MAKYIHKQAAIHALVNEANIHNNPIKRAYTRAAAIIEQITAEDVQPEKRGKWIIDNDYYTCSRCNHQFLKDKILSMTIYPSGGIPYYCPCCGARMDGDTNG